MFHGQTQIKKLRLQSYSKTKAEGVRE